jgi:hypothetical protein
VPDRRGRTTFLLPFLGAGLLLAVACGSDPTQVLPGPVEVVVAGGDSQYGTTGQTLTTPLHVVVWSLTTELPVSGRTVSWEVISGDAQIAGPTVAVTDSTGSARATVRLGATVGEVAVRATVQGEGGDFADFRLYTVDRPILDPLLVTSVAPGAPLSLTGRNFSPDPAQNVVLFSGIRGRVTAASTAALTVTVPGCLPQRSVEVRAQLGSLASEARAVDIEAGGDVSAPVIGDVLDALDPAGYTCLTLPGDGVAEYLVVAQSASAIGSASYPVSIFGLASAPVASPPAAMDGSASVLQPTQVPFRPPVSEAWWSQPFDQVAGQTDDVQGLWDLRLRAIEDEVARALPAPSEEPGPLAASGPARVPDVGERRNFQVFSGTGSFTTVTAVARYVGARAALFVDEASPAGGYTEDDLRYFSDMFDAQIEPVVTGTFGEASDLDGNDRIIILFTPAVNALTPRGAGGFIAGFFFGVDLLPGQSGSNAGEVFYSLVPDPSGTVSDPRPKNALLEVIPAVLGHEFQHMVNFNERVLKLDADGNDAVWLSEALAQYAEELVARSYEDDGDAAVAERFRDGVRNRSRRYLSRPDTVSLIVAFGQGTLPERGAGFLFATYLADRFGADVIGRLTRTTRTGVTNVEAETGTNWAPLLSDWWAATWLDGTGVGSGPLEYPSVDLRAFLTDPFPLVPDPLGGGDFSRTLSLRSSAAKYYIVSPVAGGSTTLRIGGAAGGASVPQAAVQMRVVRIR